MTKRAYEHEATPPLVLGLINILIALIWVAFIELNDFFDFVVGFLFGAVILSLLERVYIHRITRFFYFIVYVVWSILVSNFQLAWIILQPGKRLQRRLDPGIVGVPLEVDTPIEIIILATVITLTPGTLSVNLGEAEDGQRILYVHNLRVKDPEAFRQQIKTTFERRLLDVTREPVQA